MRCLPASVVLVVALAGTALAGNEIVPARIEVAANFNAASVYAYFEGDDNGNAAAKMEYRAGDARDFRLGHVLSRTGKGRFAGSLFRLLPDEPLEVRVTFDDPDSPSKPPPLAAATRTRSEKFPCGTGKTYYVAPAGDDAGTGTQDKPFKSLQHAVDLAGPGDVIDLAIGDYFEGVTVNRSGRPDAYIALRSHRIEGDARNEDGAPKRLDREGRLVGCVEPQGPWQKVEAGLYVIDEKRPVGTVTLDERRIYHHGSLEELKSAAAPLVPGWWKDEGAGKFYLRLEGSAEPRAGAVRLGVIQCGLKFEGAACWIVDNVAFAVFGGDRYGRGIEITNSRNIVVRNCRFNTMWVGVWVRKAGSAECLIERNTFDESGIWNWPWKMCKGHDVEGSAISLQGGSGNVVRFNTITGQFNGVGASTWGDLQNESLNRDLDIHDNTFREIGDDPLEPEGACMNVRFYNNRTRDTLQGISLAPITVGPTYVVRDRYVNFKQGAVKVSVNSRGAVYLYHILGWTNRPDSNALEASGPWDNMHFRNSIIRGTKYVIEDYKPHPVGCTFDYSDLFSTAPQFIKWANQRYTRFEDVPASAGFGPHNLRVEPYAKTSPEGEPVGLAPQLIDAGVVIPGINDDFKGKAPDIGPEEVR